MASFILVLRWIFG